MEQWIARYGYIGVFFGTFLEGETTVLIAGIFSKLGFLDFSKALICALAGTFVGDCTFFFLGKFCGRPLIDHYEFLRRRILMSNRIINQYGNLILFVMRFLAGFRSVILLLLGCTNLNVGRFLLLDLATCILWTALGALIGFSFANVVYIFVTDVKGYERLLVPLIVALAVAVILVYRRFIKEKERSYGN